MNVNITYDRFNLYELCEDEETKKLLIQKGLKLKTFDEFLKLIQSNPVIMETIINQCSDDEN